MRRFFRIMGTIIYYCAGFLMWLAQILSFLKWWGLIGGFVGFIMIPGLVVFPFLYWLKEGVFPIGYFAIWGTGVLAVILGGIIGSEGEDEYGEQWD